MACKLQQDCSNIIQGIPVLLFVFVIFCYFVQKINYLLFYSTLVCYVNFDFIAKYKDIFLYPIIIKY